MLIFYHFNVLRLPKSEEGLRYYFFLLEIIPISISALIFYLVTVYLYKKRGYIREIKLYQHILFLSLIGFSYDPVFFITGELKGKYYPTIFNDLFSVSTLFIVYVVFICIVCSLIPLSIVLLINKLKQT